jgi:hypothetical protein
MSEIFVSYAHEDLGMARQVAEALEAESWSVFWDRTLLPGEDWSKKIGKALDEAKCVVVLWSRAAVESDWVTSEAGEAADQGKLAPAMIEKVRLPVQFRKIHAANLVGWDGTSSHHEFRNLVQGIARILGQEPRRVEPASPPPPPPPAPTPQVVGAGDGDEKKIKPKSKPKKAKAPSKKKQQMTLQETLSATELKFLELGGGSMAFPFGGERIEQVTVEVRELGDDLVYFAVPMPEPGMFGREVAYSQVLRASYTTNFIKAMTVKSGLAFAAELPKAVVTPPVAEGVIRGLVYLADVKKKDLNDEESCNARMVKCVLAQSSLVTLDVAKTKQDVETMFAGAGLDWSKPQDDSYVFKLDFASTDLDVLIRTGEHAISVILPMGGVKPIGDKKKYLSHLLDLNRVANVAKVGIDSDGDVALLYELPELLPDTIEKVREQFVTLLAGVLAMHAGGE